MRIGFVTFGCRLNKAEALDMEAQYAADGWEVVPVGSGAKRGGPPPDVIVVRGCSVTAKAQRDCETTIAHLRARHPKAEMRVVGCMPSAGSRKPLAADCKGPTPSVLRLATDGYRAAGVNTRLSRAYLKVQDGCSCRCSYCIVPQFRGAPVSVPFGDVLARGRAFLAAGFREIVVAGCNLCLYRDGRRRLPELVAALAALESPGHRIRLGSIEPGICDGALLDAMERCPNVCRHIHLSVQSGSDRILSLMRRPYTAERVAALCDDARRRLGPRLALGADVIAGFPGETDADHEATEELLRGRFVHLHAFPYSERPGTDAAAMSPTVPAALRRARAKELERIGAANRDAFAEALAGEEVVVCVERDGNGRTDGYLRCILEGTAPRSSLAHATVKKYFPKSGALSATIRTINK